MTLAPIYHVLEVLTPELPAPGVVAHKYTGSRANVAGVTPCPEVACFGNGSGGPS